MKRSLFLQLFLIFYVVLFVALSIITASFIYSRQRMENEAAELEMLERARALAATSQDYYAARMTLGAYQTVLEHAVDEKTAIWIVNPFGIVLQVSGLPEGEELLTQQQLVASLENLLKGQELRTADMAMQSGARVRNYVVAVPVAAEGGNSFAGAVFIYRRMANISLDMLGVYEMLMALIVFALAGIPLFFMTRSVTKPLKEMALASGEYAAGHFEKRIHENRISEIDTLGQSLNKMAEDLAGLEQMRMGFVANVSHELRSPMTSMQGYVQGILDGTIPPQDHQRYLKVVFDETRRLTRLVNDLLDLSKIESGNMPIRKTRFDVCELMRRVLIKYEGRIDEKSLEVEVLFHPEQCLVYADMDRIEQVVSNLVDNAIKFVPQRGQLGLYLNQGSDFAYITVSDNGIGISKEDLPYIFDRFYKADKAHTSGKGTGLGLAIASKIMQCHGQELTCTSKQGEGTSFRFCLDLYRGQDAAQAPERP